MPPLLFVFLTVPTNKKEASQWLFSLKYRLFWRVFLLMLVNINLVFFCLFWRWNDTKLCFFFLLWACWNKFQHGRRPLGWFFKHAIASLWRLGDAVKLAKLGTRTQKNRPKPARDYLFKHTFGIKMIACSNRSVWKSIYMEIILKRAIVSLWKLGVAVKLANIGTRSQKIGPSQQETSKRSSSFFKHCYLLLS